MVKRHFFLESAAFVQVLGAGQFDTPSLLGLWMSAPYYHDGTASTLRDVFTVGGQHGILDEIGPNELSDLVDYLLALPIE